MSPVVLFNAKSDVEIKIRGFKYFRSITNKIHEKINGYNNTAKFKTSQLVNYVRSKNMIASDFYTLK